jgi:hypothetical protein
MLEAVGEAMTGKELELRSGTGSITLHLDRVTAQHDAPPVALTGLDTLDIDAHDVRWDRGRIDRLQIQARHLRFEAGVVTKLVAGPIGLIAEIDQPTLDWWLETYDAPVRVELDGDDQARVRVTRWLTATASAELDGDSVTFRPHRVHLAGIPLPWVHRFVSPRTATIPVLPRDLRPTGVRSRPGVLRVTGVVDEFREPLMIEQLMRAASTVGTHVVLNR